MAGSSFGTLFRITTWGESHGEGVGVVIDGVPAGLPLEQAQIQAYLDRRKPGQSKYTTARSEADRAHILSGIFEGKTTGTPISIAVYNEDQRSRDYTAIASCFRPGHADFTFARKYGFRDYRGGGRSSGRETIGRTAGGAVAAAVLGQLGITLTAYASSIGPVTCDPARFDRDRIAASPLCMPDEAAEREALAFLDDCIKEKTSAGGTIECRIEGLPAGIGEPVFDKLDAQLGKALFSIGAVKSVEIGDGIAASRALGHENNDTYQKGPDGRPVKASNHAGGIYGGISDGSTVLVRAGIKPTPSIARPQEMLLQDGTTGVVTIGGRHDPVIVPRAVVVVEAMCAVTVLDLLLQNASATMDNLRRIYPKKD